MEGVLRPTRRGGASKLSSDQSPRCFIGAPEQIIEKQLVDTQADIPFSAPTSCFWLISRTLLGCHELVLCTYLCMKALSGLVAITPNPSPQNRKILSRKQFKFFALINYVHL